MGPCVLSNPPSRAQVVVSKEKGAMPLHDAFGVNSEKSATTENHGAGVKYMG